MSLCPRLLYSITRPGAPLSNMKIVSIKASDELWGKTLTALEHYVGNIWTGYSKIF